MQGLSQEHSWAVKSAPGMCARDVFPKAAELNGETWKSEDFLSGEWSWEWLFWDCFWNLVGLGERIGCVGAAAVVGGGGAAVGLAVLGTLEMELAIERAACPGC